jgi:hypothetical protein
VLSPEICRTVLPSAMRVRENILVDAYAVCNKCVGNAENN